MFSLELGANGLYVGVKEGVAVIPNHVARIKEFREVIMLLYKIKVSIEELCYTIMCSNESKRMQQWMLQAAT